MKKILLPLVSVMALFCACTENEVVDSPSSDLVSFGTYVGQTTRASSVGLTELKEQHFTVAASYTGADTWAAVGEAATLNFMYNDPVTWNAGAGAWKYDHMKYWPQAGNVSFFAYSPQASANVAFSSAAIAGIPSFTYTVPDAVADQEDLLADQRTDQTRATGTVGFTFDHLLSKIGFKGTLAGTYSAVVKVTDFEVDYAASSIINKAVYAFADDNTVSDIWTPSASDYHTVGSQSVLATGGVILSTTAAQLNANDKFMMLLPQAVAAEKLTAKITYTVTYTDGTVVTNVESIKLPACTWEPGKQYTYNFNITLSKVVFDAIVVTPWGDAKIAEITGLPDDNKVSLESEAGSTAEYATTGIASITHNGTKFNVTYEGTPVTRAVSDIAGKLIFAPVAANTGTELIEETVTVTMTDVLGNQSSMDFYLVQYPPLNLAQGTTPLDSPIALLFNSQQGIYSVNASTTTPSATFTVVGVASDENVAVTLASSDFAFTKSASALTFTAQNALLAGSDNKSASATVTLTSASGNTKSYTINLTQVAPAVLMSNGTTGVAAGAIALQFKSTQAVHSGVNSYTTKNVSTVDGTLDDTSDFEVTKTTSAVSVVPTSSLTTATVGLTNKILSPGTVILTNQCGETTEYTFSATQYAVAFITRNSEVISGRYGYRTNLGGQSKTFDVVNGAVKEVGTWVNGNNSLGVRGIDQLMNPITFTNEKRSFTLSDNGVYMSSTLAWREGEIPIIVVNAINEESTYVLQVARKGGSGGDKI